MKQLRIIQFCLFLIFLITAFLTLYPAFATPPIIWGPNDQSILLQNGGFHFGITSSAPSILSGSLDPSAVATAGNPGSLYISTNGRTYEKQDSGVTTNWLIFSTGGFGGTVTSVALTTPSEFNVSGSPVTTAGTLAITSANQSANSVWAGPASGPNAPPSFRALVFDDVPSTANNTPDTIVARDGTGSIKIQDLVADGNISAANFSGSSSGTNTGDVTLSSFGSSPNSSAATLSGQALTLQPADGTNPGGVSTGTQTFAGNKTFIGTIAASNFSGSSSGTNTGDVTLSAFGSTPNANAASLSGQALTLQPASGSQPGGVSTTTQTFAGNKTFSGTIAASNFSGSSSGTNTGDVTLGTANGLSLVGQALSLGLSSTSTTGALSSTDWNTFNGKLTSTLTSAHIFVGNASNVATDTAVTGDVTITNAGVTAIGTNKVTNSQLAQMPTLTIKGNNTGGTANASDLTVSQVNTLLGVVVGPASSTDTAIAKYSGTTGKLVQNSGVTIDASNNVTGIGTLNASGAVTFGNYTASRIPFTGTAGLITVDSNLVWDNSSKTQIINDLWLANDSVTGRANDLTVGTQTSGKNLLLTPAGTGTVQSSTDIFLLNQHSLKLREGTGGGTNFAAFQAPATLAGDYTLTMPTALPASTQALVSSSGGALSFALVPTITGTWTDNHVLRADGTSAAQDSLAVLSDAGALTGTTSIAMGNTTWSNVDSLVSTDTLSVTSTNDMTLNSGSGNFNMVAFTGGINAAAKQAVQFVSTSNTVLINAQGGDATLESDGGDVVVNSTNANIQLDAPSGNIFANNDVIFGGSATHQANQSLYGSGNEASISYATNLIVNPAASGSGILFVGNGTTAAQTQVGHLGIVSTPSNAALVSTTESSSVTSTGIVMGLTHTGATATMRGMNFTVTHAGSATNPAVSSAFTSTHTNNSSGTTTILGLQPTSSAGAASTQGTKVYEGIRTTVTDGGFTHTGGTIRATSLRALNPSAFAGGATVTTWAGLFEGDTQINSDQKLLLEGSATTKGDSYFTYASATPSINTFLDGVQAWTYTTSLNKSEVVLSTKAGTSTTYGKVGGVVEVNTSSVSNGTTVETDLMTYSVPANSMATNGDSISFEVAGSYAATANTKRLRVKYGATTMFDSTALAINSGAWRCHGRIIRTGAATQVYWINCGTDNALLIDSTKQGTAAETLSGAVTFKTTGQSSAASNDITQTINHVKYDPNK